MSAPDANGWIEWHGGKCPVEPETQIQFRVAGESKEEAEWWHAVNAGDCRWGHRGIMYSDIVAYRVVSAMTDRTRPSDALARPVLTVVPDLKAMLVKSVILAALENLLKHDADIALKAQVSRRYCELTGGLHDPS